MHNQTQQSILKIMCAQSPSVKIVTRSYYAILIGQLQFQVCEIYAKFTGYTPSDLDLMVTPAMMAWICEFVTTSN